MSGNTWRHNPPCKAQKLLAEMFENGKITDKTSPKVAQSFHSEFSKFTLAVFSNNFRQLRQLHLAECNIFETFNLPLFPNIINFFVTFSVKQSSPTKCQDETTSSASTSTASTSTLISNASKRQHSDDLDASNCEVGERDDGITHKNQPAIMTVYKDPESLCEQVCVCVALPSGVTDVKFSLLGSGPATTTAKISYTWPEIMFSVEGLFAVEIKNNSLSSTHPLIVGLKLELENNRSNIAAKPEGSIELTLPIPVQTDSKTVGYKAGRNADGVIIMIARLSAFHNSYTKEKTEFDCQFQDF